MIQIFERYSAINFRDTYHIVAHIAIGVMRCSTAKSAYKHFLYVFALAYSATNRFFSCGLPTVSRQDSPIRKINPIEILYRTHSTPLPELPQTTGGIRQQQRPAGGRMRHLMKSLSSPAPLQPLSLLLLRLPRWQSVWCLIHRM